LGLAVLNVMDDACECICILYVFKILCY